MDKWDREFEEETGGRFIDHRCTIFGNDKCIGLENTYTEWLKAKLDWQEGHYGISIRKIKRQRAEINKIDKVIDDNIKYWRKKEKVLRRKYAFPSRCIKEVMSIRGIILSLQKEINKLKRGGR